MKRLIACILAVAVCAGLAGCGTKVEAEGRNAWEARPLKEGEAPAVEPMAAASGKSDAVGDADDGSAVTAAVKKKLGLDTEAYPYFRCESEEDPLEKRWRLYWGGTDGESLEIMAGDDGDVLSYAFDDGGGHVGYWYGGSSSEMPKFPAGDAKKAAKAAEAFVKKCLSKGETLELDSEPLYAALGSDYYRFSGRILLNGLPAGIDCSVNVSARDNSILLFRRTDWRGLVKDDVPKLDASIGDKAAHGKLAGKLELEAEYVLPEGSKEAYLVYKPVDADTYYVDAKTGELVNLSEAARKAKAPLTFRADGGASKDMNGMEDSVESPKAEGGLTDAELSGTERFGGAMPREKLDEAARKYKSLGLDGYGLSAVRYFASDLSDEEAEDEITAKLTYSKTFGEGNWTRTVTLDATTGKLLSVWSSMYSGGEDAKGLRMVTGSKAQAVAEAFLEEVVPGKASRVEMDVANDVDDDDWSFECRYSWHQVEAGYPYYGNRLDVGIDATDGSVCYWSDSFDDEVTFAPVDDIFSEEEALKAWADTYGAVLQYVQVPFAVDVSVPEYKELEGTWVEYMYDLVPGYALYRADDLMGIRADTCEPEPFPWSDDRGYAYSDVDGSDETGAMVLELARYGIGLGGGKFDMDEPLTEAVLEELLAGLNDRYAYMRAGDEAVADGQDKVLDRGSAVYAIAKAVAPEELLSWSGMYQAGYGDWKSVPDKLKGCAAFAAASGMLDGSGKFDAGGSVTRGDAAVMLYRFLDR